MMIFKFFHQNKTLKLLNLSFAPINWTSNLVNLSFAPKTEPWTYRTEPWTHPGSTQH